jgi:UDP-sugar pyrophosphorylase
MIMEFYIPPGLEKALPSFTPSQQTLLKALASPECGQAHLFADWSKATSPALLRQLAEQLELLDASYAEGGLVGYIHNAKRLLYSSQQGINPLEAWTPSIPTAGQMFTLGTPEYQETEAQGMEELGKVGFVLVAGGLGERLGYNGIKVWTKNLLDEEFV